MAAVLGMNAKLYRNTGTYSTPTWNEILNVRDLTLSLESSEADTTTRNNAGWRATTAALRDASVEFEMVWDTSDDDFTAIQSAYFAGTPIELAIMDGPITTTGSQGLRASFSVLTFSRSEPLEEVITVSVTMKPTYSTNPPTWYTVS